MTRPRHPGGFDVGGRGLWLSIPSLAGKPPVSYEDPSPTLDVGVSFSLPCPGAGAQGGALQPLKVRTLRTCVRITTRGNETVENGRPGQDRDPFKQITKYGASR